MGDCVPPSMVRAVFFFYALGYSSHADDAHVFGMFPYLPAALVHD